MKPQTRRRLKQFARALGRTSASWAGAPLLATLARTWRVVREGEERLESSTAVGGGRLMTLWHGRMIVPLAHHRGRGFQVLVSASEDGDVSERMLRAFGYGVIRGSSSRKGVRALREMLAARAKGAVLVLTPDGPRGPRHTMNHGVAWLARTTGYAVLPCGYVCDRAWHLRSWDRFTIPKPFARVAFVYEEPVRVAPDAGEDEELRATELIRERILRAEARGFELLGVPPDW